MLYCSKALELSEGENVTPTVPLTRRIGKEEDRQLGHMKQFSSTASNTRGGTVCTKVAGSSN